MDVGINIKVDYLDFCWDFKSVKKKLGTLYLRKRG